jgi:hypothetical protein
VTDDAAASEARLRHSDGRMRWVRVGDELDGAQVTRIGAESIELRAPNGETTTIRRLPRPGDDGSAGADPGGRPFDMRDYLTGPNTDPSPGEAGTAPADAAVGEPPATRVVTLQPADAFAVKAGWKESSSTARTSFSNPPSTPRAGSKAHASPGSSPAAFSRATA